MASSIEPGGPVEMKREAADALPFGEGTIIYGESHCHNSCSNGMCISNCACGSQSLSGCDRAPEI